MYPTYRQDDIETRNLDPLCEVYTEDTWFLKVLWRESELDNFGTFIQEIEALREITEFNLSNVTDFGGKVVILKDLLRIRQAVQKI